jgi:hypothetical protein
MHICMYYVFKLLLLPPLTSHIFKPFLAN